MREEGLLFVYNKGVDTSVKLHHKLCCCVFNNSAKEFNGDGIDKLIRFLNGVHQKWGQTKVPIVINLGKVQFADKLTYVILESLCFYEAILFGRKVNIIGELSNKKINTSGVSASTLPLYQVKKLNTSEIEAKYLRSKESIRTYRNYIQREKMTEETPSDILSDLRYFFSMCEVEEQSAGKLAKLISELVDNVYNHTASDCLVDIDVTSDDYLSSRKEDDNTYYAINVVVMNISDTLFGDGLREKYAKTDVNLTERDEKALMAYNFHKKRFDDEYTEEVFFNILAFQQHITSREYKSKRKTDLTGGTGLNSLIEELQAKSEDYRCYMISGKKALELEKQYMKFNDEGFIGFNEDNEFISALPDKRTHGQGYIYMPGTAYNLTFVMRKEDKNGNIQSYI